MSNQSNLRNTKTAYRSYKQLNLQSYVDLSTYRYICNNFSKFLIEKVLSGEKVTLPARLGTLSIVGRKQKIRFDKDGKVLGLAPDWVKTKELWQKSEQAKAEKKKVYCTNEHSSGIRYRYLWSKNRVLIPQKSLYSLKMTRENKRAVHSKVKNGFEYITSN